jgi:hypothetical protein
MSRKLLFTFLASLVAFTSSCSKREKSYLDEQSFPASCQGRDLSSLRSRLQTCVASEADHDLFDFCLTSLRTQYDKLSSACRASYDTQSLFASGLRDVLKLAVRYSTSQAVAPEFNYSGTSKWIYVWLSNYGSLFTNPSVPNTAAKDLSIEFNLSEVVAEMMKEVHSKATRELQKAAVTAETNSAAKVLASSHYLHQHYAALLKDASDNFIESRDAPLYYAFMVGQTLRSLKAEVDVLATMHDMVCSLTVCDFSSNDRIAQIFKLLANIDNPIEYQALWSSLKTTDFAKTDADSYRLIFDSFAAHGDKIQKSIARSLASLGLPAEAYSDLLNYSVDGFEAKSKLSIDFVKSVQFWKESALRYQKTGQFVNSSTGLLNYPFNKDFLAVATGEVEGLKASIKVQKDSYKAQRADLLTLLDNYQNGVAQEIQNRITIESLNSQLTAARADVAGLQEAILKQDDALDAFSGQIESLKKAADAENDFRVKYAQPESFNVAATDSKFSKGGLSTYVPSDYSFRSITLAAGEILRLDVSGNWSPTCALKSETLKNKNLENMVTGPEGYNYIFSNGETEVRSRTNSSRTTSYRDQSITGSICSGASEPTLIATACAQGGSGKRDETTTSLDRTQSWTSSKSATYSSAMRLKDTPFRSLPGGALLGFVMDAKDPSAPFFEALDATMIGNNSTIIAHQDVVVHLVVNDCVDGNSDLNKLQVAEQILVPASERISSLAPELFRRLKGVRAETAEILKEGVDISRQIQVKKQEIRNRALQALPNLKNEIVLLQVFDFFLDNEALQIERQALIELKNREIERLSDEIRRIQVAGSSMVSSNFIRQIQLNSELENFDSNLLSRVIRRAAAKMSKDYAPVFTFFFEKHFIDEYLAEERSDVLLSLQLGQHATVIADKAEIFLGALSTEAKTWAFALDQRETLKTIAIRLPHPFRQSVTEKPGQPYVDLPIVTAEAGVSSAFWEALFIPERNQPAAITLRFEDIYQGNKRGSLDCELVKPIIFDSALILVTNHATVTSETLSNLNTDANVTVSFGPEVRIAGSEGLSSYWLSSGFLTSSMKIGFQKLADLQERNYGESIFDRSTDSNAGSGISPFTTVEFSKQSLRKLFEDPSVAFTLGLSQAPSSTTVPSGPRLPPGFARQPASSAQFPSNLTDILLLYRIKVRGDANPTMNEVRTCVEQM